MSYWRLMIVFLCLLTASNSFAVQSKFGVTHQLTVAVTGTSAKQLDADPYREYLLVQNLGSDSIYVHLNGSASNGILIVAGGYWEPVKAPTDSVWLKALSGSQNTVLVDGE